jgi:hypothetical protein
MGSKPITQRAKCNYNRMPGQPEVTVDAAGKQRASFPSSAPRAIGKQVSGFDPNKTFAPSLNFSANQQLIQGANTNAAGNARIQITAPGTGNDNEGENSTTNIDKPTTAIGVYERAGQMRRNYMAQSRQEAKGMEGKARRDYMKGQRQKSRQLKHKYIGDELGTWDINE